FPAKNRIHVQTGGAANINLSYSMNANQRDISGTFVAADMGLFTAATLCVTLAEKAHRPHEAHLELPQGWPVSISSMEAAPDGKPNHSIAPDYDILVDSPIVAAQLSIHEFDVDGAKFYLTDAGAPANWDGKLAAENLQ